MDNPRDEASEEFTYQIDAKVYSKMLELHTILDSKFCNKNVVYSHAGLEFCYRFTSTGMSDGEFESESHGWRIIEFDEDGKDYKDCNSLCLTCEPKSHALTDYEIRLWALSIDTLTEVRHYFTYDQKLIDFSEVNK